VGNIRPNLKLFPNEIVRMNKYYVFLWFCMAKSISFYNVFFSAKKSRLLSNQKIKGKKIKMVNTSSPPPMALPFSPL